MPCIAASKTSLLLWTGELPAAGLAGPGDRDGAAWQATAEALAVGRAAQSALPAGTLPLERLQVIVPALAATDPFRLQLDRPAVVAAGRAMIAGMTGALPAASGEACTGGASCGEARRCACTQPVPAGLIRVLNAALVLLADHELAASTLAARVAASMRADPYAVVATGLGAMGGALHGGAALGAELMLGSADTATDAPRVVGDLLRRGERLPGFGHFVYTSGDPRANLLLQLIGDYAPGSPQLAIAMAVTDEARRRGCLSPTSSSPSPCWLGSRAWFAALARPFSPPVGRRAGWRTRRGVRAQHPHPPPWCLHWPVSDLTVEGVRVGWQMGRCQA